MKEVFYSLVLSAAYLEASRATVYRTDGFEDMNGGVVKIYRQLCGFGIIVLRFRLSIVPLRVLCVNSDGVLVVITTTRFRRKTDTHSH